jgi:methionyl-tRNA formyltransferase
VARELGLEFDQPESVNDEPARARIAAAQPDAVVVCAFGALIKEPLLSDYEMLNVHPSLLPRWRGAAPVERAMMAGDTQTGVSIMRVTAGLDSGPVCAQITTPIDETDTYGSLAERLQGLGAQLLTDVLDRHPDCVEQDEAGVTYAEKITPADRLLVSTRGAVELSRVVRALNPHIGAAIELSEGGRLGIWEARFRDPGQGEALAPGELDLDGQSPVLGCSPGALELLVVQPPGRRAMTGADWLRGRRL